jgi:exopolysaccharide transport family protein
MLQRANNYSSHEDLVEVSPVVAGGEVANYSAQIRELIQVLLRRRWSVLLTALTFLALAGTFILLATPRYTATTTIFIDPRRSSVIDTNSSNQQATSSAAEDAVVNSQVSLMQSVAVLRRVVTQLDLAHDSEFGPRSSILGAILGFISPSTPAPSGLSADDIATFHAIEFLTKRMTATRQGQTYLVDVGISSESPEKAAKIANALADAYFYEQVRGKYDTNKIAASWFNEQIEGLRSQVQASDRAVEEFRAANNLTIAQGVTVNDQQLGDLNNKLVDAHVATAEARAKYQQVQDIAKNRSDPGAVAEVLSSEVITRLRTQYADVAKQLADASSRYGPQNPLVANGRAQLRETQKLIDQEVHRYLENAQQAYEVAKSREEALQKSLDHLKQVSDNSGKERVRLRELQREADSNRMLYESFLSRYKEVNAQESLNLPDSRIVSRADIPVKPSYPKTLLVLAGAIALGIGFGCVLAFTIDFFDQRLKSLRQIEVATGLPALAAVPVIGTRELAGRAKQGRRELERYKPDAAEMLPPALQPSLMRYVVDEPTSLFAEAVRTVRLAVQRASRNEPAKSVMITSATDGEGKTTLAVNLAHSLAAIGMRTILLDGDFRNPEMSRSLCPRASIGAMEVALGKAPIDRAIFVDQSTGLAVLPARPAARSSEFVSSEPMRRMLDLLRQHFDFVIVDSPPLFPLIDARELADIVDGIVVTARWDHTPQEVVTQAISALAPVRDHILGTVLTRVDMQRLRFYDYYQSSTYLRPYSYLGQPRAAEHA